MNFLLDAWEMFTKHFSIFMIGLGATLSLALLSVIFATIFGTLICLMNMSKSRILQTITRTYIEIIRGIPLLLQLMVIIMITPKGASLYISSLVAIVINSSAYVAEIIRADINAVDLGQFEAGRSLGFSKSQTMIKIIFPQAIKNILPSLCNEFIMLIKETSLASVLGVRELMLVQKEFASVTYDPLTPFFIIACMYFIITFSLSKGVKKIEGILST